MKRVNSSGSYGSLAAEQTGRRSLWYGMKVTPTKSECKRVEKSVEKYFKIISVFILLFFSSLFAHAECTCTADPYSKKYSEYRKTWYGSVRAWNCAYTCTDGVETEALIGNHRDRYYGDETGLEGICDGLIYKHEYIIVMNIFTYAYAGIGSVDPAKSSSEDLKSWAARHPNCR